MTLSEYRAAHGLSATEMGRRVGVRHSTVLRWESGAQVPRPRQAIAVEAATRGAVTAAEMMNAAIEATEKAA